MSMVIFLMGLLKFALTRKVKNSLLRKVLLSWGSVIITLPTTALMVFCKNFGWEHFWTIYVLNCIGVIIVYWVYENTAIRNSLALIGKKLVTKVLLTFQNPEELKESVKSVDKDIQALLDRTKSSSKYDDDLNNL